MTEPLHQPSGRRRKKDQSPLRRAIRILEASGGALICLMLIATPWLFGSTEDWSVRLMNVAGFIAALPMLAAAILRRTGGYEHEDQRPIAERILGYAFLTLNVAILAYCAIALWNARATFSVGRQSFTYFDDFNRSLPTTYDAHLTRQTLISFTACFLVFWSTRYWLRNGGAGPTSGILANRRFRVLAWVLSLNGFVLAIQGILQRLGNSSKLLWLRESYYGNATAAFGPFSYRGNAAEYLNLLWPVALGLWWILSRERRRREGSVRFVSDGPELLLLPVTVTMLAACLISMSRGGAIVAAGTLAIIGVIFIAQRNISRRARLGFLGLVVLVLGMVGVLGLDQLTARFKRSGLTDLSGREEIYHNARQMAVDYPWFGTGPGTFRSVYHLYREKPGELWHGFLHDDWMETRVTMGRIGLALVIAQLLVLGGWIFSPGRPGVYYIFSAAGAIGLGGALIHAKFDFPFQTYSIFFTFVVISALLVSVSPTRK